MCSLANSFFAIHRSHTVLFHPRMIKSSIIKLHISFFYSLSLSPSSSCDIDKSPDRRIQFSLHSPVSLHTSKYPIRSHYTIDIIHIQNNFSSASCSSSHTIKCRLSGRIIWNICHPLHPYFRRPSPHTNSIPAKPAHKHTHTQTSKYKFVLIIHFFSLFHLHPAEAAVS